MKKEITVRKCVSEIFWNRLAHAIWMTIVLSLLSIALGNAILSSLSFDSAKNFYMFLTNDLVLLILSLVAYAVISFFGLKLTNRYVAKKYNIDKEMLKKVEKVLLIIGITLSIILLAYNIVTVKTEAEEAFETYKELGIEFGENVSALESSYLSDKYVYEAISGILSLILEVVMVKYLVFDLERRISLS